MLAAVILAGGASNLNIYWQVAGATTLGTGDDPVRDVLPGEPPADIRLTASSDEVIALSQQPMNIARAWVTGKIKIEASMKDLFRLRRLL